jgi:hypothetical protein
MKRSALQRRRWGPQLRFRAGARLSSSEFGRLTTSKGARVFRCSTSFTISLRWKPCSPRSMDTVSSPRSFGSVLTP